MFKGFIFDLDGTVFLSDRLIPGADRVIKLIQEKGRKVIFLSNRPLPTCGVIISALEAVTLKKVEVIVGEPSLTMAEAVLEALGLRADDCILIGDRLETDIKMAKDSGMAAGIVLTGVTDEKTLKESSLHPDFIFQSIADVDNLLIG